MKKIKLFMTKKRTFYSCLLVGVMAVACITACNKADFGNNIAKPVTTVSGIHIDATDTLYLLQGKDSTLSFSVLPDSATNPKVEWRTSDSSIVTVQQGKIHAAGLGTAKISVGATDGTLKAASVVVAVIDHIEKITSIDFSNVGDDTALYEGDTLTIKATIAPFNATYKNLQWSSSNTAIASVSDNGQVKAIAKGNATITATATDGSGTTASLHLNVIEVVPVQNVSITSAFPDPLGLGETEKLTYSVQPANATLNSLVWSSSAPDVVSVSQDGTISALAQGNARITVTSKYDGSVSSYIDLVVESGKIDDAFNSTITPWITSTAGAKSSIQNGEFVVTMALSGTKYRGDFQRKGGATVNAGTYPIIAFKMKRPEGAAGGANLTFDTNLGAFGNGSNKFSTETASDGMTVYYYNIATGTFGTDTKLSTTSSTAFTTFQLKIADLVLSSDEVAAGKNIYQVSWVKSFKSVNDMEAFINQ